MDENWNKKELFSLNGNELVPDWRRRFSVEELIKYIPGYRYEGIVICMRSGGRDHFTWGSPDSSIVFPGSTPESARRIMMERLRAEFPDLWSLEFRNEGRLTEIVTPCPVSAWLLPPFARVERGPIEHDDMMEYIRQQLKSWYREDLGISVHD